jgi:hypothetical protein
MSLRLERLRHGNNRGLFRRLSDGAQRELHHPTDTLLQFRKARQDCL